jgi:hypothetical protein
MTALIVLGYLAASMCLTVFAGRIFGWADTAPAESQARRARYPYRAVVATLIACLALATLAACGPPTVSL